MLLLKLLKKKGVEQVFIHAFTDGRDTGPHTGLGFIKAIEEKCAELGIGKIASVCGRFWSMDRDKRWDRVQKAYNCLTGRSPERTATSAQEAIQHYYDHPSDPRSMCGDEFITPTVIAPASDHSKYALADGDAFIFFNYRTDRGRELSHALLDGDFPHFHRSAPPQQL